MQNEVKTDETQVSSQEETKIILPFEREDGKEYFIEDLGRIKRKPFYSFVKRLVDIIAGLLGIIVFAIPMIIIAILVKVDSKGSVFYAQERLGLNGKKIKVLKFRTMCQNAEKNGAQWSGGKNDSRITKVGKKLRDFRLDEIPQFFCIFVGSMTLVGPRPERECFYEEFEKYVHGFSERLKVKPGLTGLAQVNGGYDLKPEEKIIYDIEYIKKRSLWLDLKIMFKTVAVVFTHDGAK